MKRLLISSLAVLSLQLAACGAGMEEGEGQTPPAPAVDDTTQLGPIGGLQYGTHVSYYTDSSKTVLVGEREWGCPPSTYLINWGATSAYSLTWKFLCAQEPQQVQ
ncbi:MULTISPECIES: hypothetical protein [unclassified Corallococcus]|uniref:hypothetical protein n=1 Tax=unclassified Corallococcus TaxID=2685029 RepID=UPI001CBD17E1|nr:MULTISPECIES: hypothetical protein [unclassified Corallococcus]MBZ4333410.1 hypothetical protein [Corallococcus sp. AS-1-12]MBZ4371906.1 hypothetical protein [Corallococcus sp. AS-1-6]